MRNSDSLPARAEPEPHFERQRIDEITPEDRRLIDEHIAKKGITKVARGISAEIPAGPATSEYKEAMRRKTERDRKFRQAGARAQPVASDPQPDRVSRDVPAGSQQRGDAPRAGAATRAGESAASAPDPGLNPVPAVRADIRGGKHVPSWAQVCRFGEVPVTQLRIRGESYQREVGRNGGRRVVRLAENFDWARFGVIVVFPAGDLFEIVDGQHRAAAARLRGIRKVPAVIVLNGQGAVSFLGINRDRAALDAAQLYHAELIAGEAEAVALAGILDRLGIDVPRHQTQRGMPAMATRAVSVLRQELRARGPEVLASALWVVAKAWPEQRGAFTAEMVRALARVAAEIAAAPDLAGSVEAEHAALVDTLRTALPDEWRRKAKAAGAEHGGAAHAHLARLICNAHAERGGVEIAVGV